MMICLFLMFSLHQDLMLLEQVVLLSKFLEEDNDQGNEQDDTKDDKSNPEGSGEDTSSTRNRLNVILDALDRVVIEGVNSNVGRSDSSSGKRDSNLREDVVLLDFVGFEPRRDPELSVIGGLSIEGVGVDSVSGDLGGGLDSNGSDDVLTSIGVEGVSDEGSVIDEVDVVLFFVLKTSESDNSEVLGGDVESVLDGVGSVSVVHLEDIEGCLLLLSRSVITDLVVVEVSGGDEGFDGFVVCSAQSDSFPDDTSGLLVSGESVSQRETLDLVGVLSALDISVKAQISDSETVVGVDDGDGVLSGSSFIISADIEG